MKIKEWNLKSFSAAKGFTLIEVLTAISISFILITILVRLLGFSIDLMDFTVQRDQLLFNGRGAVDYIEREINRSYKIHSVKDKNHTSGEDLGFILEIKPYGETKEERQFVLYTLNREKLRRRTLKTDKPFTEAGDINKGNNIIAEEISSLQGSYYDSSRHMIRLNITTTDNRSYSMEVYVGDKINET